MRKSGGEVLCLLFGTLWRCEANGLCVLHVGSFCSITSPSVFLVRYGVGVFGWLDVEVEMPRPWDNFAERSAITCN